MAFHLAFLIGFLTIRGPFMACRPCSCVNCWQRAGHRSGQRACFRPTPHRLGASRADFLEFSGLRGRFAGLPPPPRPAPPPTKLKFSSARHFCLFYRADFLRFFQIWPKNPENRPFSRKKKRSIFRFSHFSISKNTHFTATSSEACTPPLCGVKGTVFCVFWFLTRAGAAVEATPNKTRGCRGILAGDPDFGP